MRKSLTRLAALLPVGSSERRTILRMAIIRPRIGPPRLVEPAPLHEKYTDDLLRFESVILDSDSGTPDPDGDSGLIRAYIPEYPKPVGELYWLRKGSKYQIGGIGVASQYKRRNIATLLYRRLFREQKISESDLIKGYQTPEGKAFRSRARARFASHHPLTKRSHHEGYCE
jgi:hypothetical protein